MHIIQKFGVVTTLSAAIFTTTTQAETLIVNDFTLSVEMNGDGNDDLRINGVIAHSDGLILLDDQPVIVGGMTVVTGLAGPGGNACGAAPFVVRVDDGDLPQVDGPLISCREFDVQIGEESIAYSTVAAPAFSGESWIWTPESGFVQGPDIPFAADPAQSWDNLAEIVDRHPADAMRIPGVLDTLIAGLGADWPLYAERMSGIGSGDMVGDDYLGQVCIKNTCDEDRALIYLAAATQQVFVAFHVGEEQGIRAWPADLAAWPQAARDAIAQ